VKAKKGDKGYCPQFRTRRGITLLEMIVVVSIIGLMVGLSFPSITAGLDSVRMVSATDSVAAFLNAAVTRAQRRQQAVEIIISPRENLIAMYSNDYTRELKLPDGVFVEAVLPAMSESGDMAQRFILMPGGTVPGISIQLANRRDTHRLVKLDPMTGFPRVESVNSK
jgi:prepilin-type N-terminal cleavage/methylation domain-containing protein